VCGCLRVRAFVHAANFVPSNCPKGLRNTSTSILPYTHERASLIYIMTHCHDYSGCTDKEGRSVVGCATKTEGVLLDVAVYVF